jgi:hypothetical protein
MTFRLAAQCLNHYATACPSSQTITVVTASVKENDGIAVYVPKEAILKEMAANITLRDSFLFYLIRELSDNPRITIFNETLIHADIRTSKTSLHSDNLKTSYIDL